MKEELIKKEMKQNLVEKVKAMKEVGHVFENAMDNNAKNTKELYDVLKKELETNEHLADDFRKVAEKEIDAYEKAIDTSTSEEQRRILYDKIEKVVGDVKKKYDDIMASNKEVRESAIKVDEENKKNNWGFVFNFGLCVLATIGVVKYIEKK